MARWTEEGAIIAPFCWRVAKAQTHMPKTCCTAKSRAQAWPPSPLKPFSFPRARSCSYSAVLAGLAAHVELSALDLCQEVAFCCESFAEHGWDFICCASQWSSLTLAFLTAAQRTLLLPTPEIIRPVCLTNTSLYFKAAALVSVGRRSTTSGLCQTRRTLCSPVAAVA